MGIETFASKQRKIIIGRIMKYTDEKTLAQLLETSIDASDKSLYTEQNLSDYISYKRERVLPRLIEAITLIDSGKYGTCQKCGGKIPHQRLEMVPGAINCKNCEEI